MSMTPWPNGKALLSGGKDWEFESPRCRVIRTLFVFTNPKFLFAPHIFDPATPESLESLLLIESI